MSTQIQKAEVNQFAAHTERIKVYDAAFHNAFSQQMGYAYLAGCELNAIKEALPHGEFMKWKAKFLPAIPHRSATQYMTFQTKLASVANLPTVGECRLLGNGELPEKEKEKILKAVHQAADGKTLTQLYRDLGVIREKKHPVHTPRKTVSPEDQVDAEEKTAVELANVFLTAAATLALDDKTILKLSAVKKAEVLAASIKVSDLIRKFSKKGKA
ncbi:MAG: hypothetical protein HOP33_09150 [Verrucomicrobia bacterium]|nr:hypothetical protein [Verrucomicrobiota bacterium]